MALFKRVTIVGLGLIGGSLGMVIRRRRLAREVIGLSREPSTIAHAKRLGAIDRGTTSMEVAVRDADLVVLATPVETIVPYAKRLARAMPAGSILTDMGSTKGRIVGALSRSLPRQIAFVGAHPLAGSEQRGIAAARADLFKGSCCIVTATARTNRRALQQVSRFWRSVAQRVIVMDPNTHDRLLAAVSHLPHLLAFCLVEATNHGALHLAPRSFLDATRVAKSEPALWDDIFLSNRSALLAAVKRFDRTWEQVRSLLAAADRRALKRFLQHAHAIRTTLRDS